MNFLKSLLVCLTFLLVTAVPTYAQTQGTPIGQIYEKARVLKIVSQHEKSINGVKSADQKLQVLVLDGPDRGKKVLFDSGKETTLSPSQIVKEHQTVVLTKTLNQDKKVSYMVYDTYRIGSLLYLFFAFLIFVIFIAGWKGLGSIVGLFISLSVIFFYIVPSILHGANPLIISFYGSLVILFVTTYLAHGISKQTTVALLSTFIALLLTIGIASFAVTFSHLSGLTEETSTLQFGQTSIINLQGLLLGGIIIGTLGALNDITTTQAASVFELAKAGSNTFKQLFGKGFSIGREHIVSMVNTLVLAYAGSGLALFLFIQLNPQHVPAWVMINSEDISSEIVRTIAGSIGLILVVPIVTFLSAVVTNHEVKRAVREIASSLK